jgi:hypothetical protein
MIVLPILREEIGWFQSCGGPNALEDQPWPREGMAKTTEMSTVSENLRKTPKSMRENRSFYD